MRTIWREILMSVMMGFLLPGILLNWEMGGEQLQENTEVRPASPQPSAKPVRLAMRLRRSDGSVEEMDMDTYLVGVVLAEMPSTFAMEAKKAQAVAARTFTRKAYLTGGKHGDGSVCAKSGCCQAWVTAEEYLQMGGSEKALLEARAAVDATSGYVLTYEGALIEATYFSCSGGSTEDAVAVWGSEFPYLVSVESPGEEHAVHHTDTVLFTKAELEDALGIDLKGDAERWFGDMTYTQGGGVESIIIGGKNFSGTELRSLLGLRSTAFDLEATEEEITITTRGFGHRVGLSQYGADAMASAGHDFSEILAYYYPGTTLELTNDSP